MNFSLLDLDRYFGKRNRRPNQTILDLNWPSAENNMNLELEILKARTRRHFFRDCGVGIGSVALASLLDDRLFAESIRPNDNPLSPRQPHFKAKAKSVIYMHMAGSPSVLDLFDPKPKLVEMNGKPCPQEYMKGQQFAFIKGVPKLLGSPHKFAPRGKSGQVMSAIIPQLATVADELTVIRSMYTDQFNHAPAQLFLHTGSPRLGRPSMGSWVSYGLGSENKDLPSFVVLVSTPKRPTAVHLYGAAVSCPPCIKGFNCVPGRAGVISEQPRRNEVRRSAQITRTCSRR